MGCGSILGDLFYLADALIATNDSGQTLPYTSAPIAWSPRTGLDIPGDVRAHLYQMHGEGHVSEEVFQALLALAEQGHLRPADLAVHQVRARRGAAQKGDAAIGNALSGIRSRLDQMHLARADSEKVLADLENRLRELDERIAAKEQAARQVVAQDEETARRYLADKVELAGSHVRLADQAHALRTDLSRLDDLSVQLEAKVIELESVQARSVTAQFFR